jgi:heptosyltransferase II
MSGHPPSSILDPRRILVRGVNWLGDAVMTTPALQRLRERFPKARLTLLTPEKLKELWLHHPSVDEVIIFRPGSSPWAVASRIRAAQNPPFDLALVLPNSPRAALEAWLAGIPHRVGYARPWRNWWLTEAVSPCAEQIPMHKRSPREIKRLVAQARPQSSSRNTQHATRNTHHIYHYLQLAAALGADPVPLAPWLQVQLDEVKDAAQRFGFSLDSCERQAHPLFGLNPGAEYGPAKRWPAERFIAAAAELQRRTNCQWVIFGGPAEVELARQIAGGLHSLQGQNSGTVVPALNLAGKTTLRQLMAVLKACRVLLTNDTGPMHVGAALGTPVVVPFGSTSPELTGPGLPGDARHQLLRAGVPCSPCFRRTCPIDFRCMTSIATEEVVEGVMKTQGHQKIES